ncbi:hypothetical protein F0562_018605 [Nyssa sinensis]|uniref:Uncharacterized protein n=1 Tax=Nyssa sinensis TaxID=561372 RepID=A0A5J4ZDD0_9ASTE|nr:hypothetical protein F0562_018605 [Nyssa sinensis]
MVGSARVMNLRINPDYDRDVCDMETVLKTRKMVFMLASRGVSNKVMNLRINSGYDRHVCDKEMVPKTRETVLAVVWRGVSSNYSLQIGLHGGMERKWQLLLAVDMFSINLISPIGS